MGSDARAVGDGLAVLHGFGPSGLGCARTCIGFEGAEGVPPVIVPPVAVTAPRAPSLKLDFIESAALRKGEVATPAAACPTAPMPEATPDAPLFPAEPRA